MHLYLSQHRGNVIGIFDDKARAEYYGTVTELLLNHAALKSYYVIDNEIIETNINFPEESIGEVKVIRAHSIKEVKRRLNE